MKVVSYYSLVRKRDKLEKMLGRLKNPIKVSEMREDLAEVNNEIERRLTLLGTKFF